MRQVKGSNHAPPPPPPPSPLPPPPRHFPEEHSHVATLPYTFSVGGSCIQEQRRMVFISEDFFFYCPFSSVNNTLPSGCTTHCRIVFRFRFLQSSLWFSVIRVYNCSFGRYSYGNLTSGIPTHGTTQAPPKVLGETDPYPTASEGLRPTNKFFHIIAGKNPFTDNRTPPPKNYHMKLEKRNTR